MTLHYYGMLDALESCYAFQELDAKGMNLYIQNSPRFGYEPATMTIKNPALFVEGKAGFYRFVIEDFEVEVQNGLLILSEIELNSIVQRLKEFKLEK